MPRKWATLRGARAAIAFLTRLPIGGEPYAPDEWRWCSAWFPAVGVSVGLAAACAFRATQSAGFGVAAMIALIVGLLFTGAFHEDGLADTADALGGAYDRETLFAILKDSRVGAFGAVALVASVGLKAALLSALGLRAPWALVLAHGLARVPPVWLMATVPYVTPAGGKSHSLAHAGAAQVTVATLTGAGALLAAVVTHRLTWVGATALVGSLVTVALVCGWRFRVRAGGITGDFLGATEQIAEATVLLALALA